MHQQDPVDEVASALAAIAINEYFTEIGKSICGETLNVIPVGLDPPYLADSSQVYRSPSKLRNCAIGLIPSEFTFQEPIGGHGQVDIGLSGAFAFFLMYYTNDNLTKWNLDTGLEYKKKSRPARIWKVHHNMLKTCQDIMDIVFAKFGLSFCIRNDKLMFVTFSDESFPRSHKDGGKSGQSFFRVLWDFHPRGRILSLNSKNVGLFFENCGFELCSQVMCGNIPLPNSHIHLRHQGWDDPDRHRKPGCGLLTALLDIDVTVNTDSASVIDVVNSPLFKAALSAEMKKFVIKSMKIYVKNRRGASRRSLETDQEQLNRKLVQSWHKIVKAKKFPTKSTSGYEDSDYVDPVTNNYLQALFRCLSD